VNRRKKFVGMSGRASFSLALLVCALVLSSTTAGSAAPGAKFALVDPLPVGTFATFAMSRTKDGTLHLIYQTTTGTSSAPTGLGTRTIGAAGVLGPQVQALKGWTTSIPGLVVLPNGMLEAVFGATSPKPKQTSGLWAISSSNGGASWNAPTQVDAGGPKEPQAYGANIRAEHSGSTTVLSLNVAGGIVIQRGLGAKMPTTSITTGADNFAGDVDSALDAATKTMIVSWDSNAHSGGDYIKGATGGKTMKVPGQTRNEVVISGRDQGPGVFAAYTPDGKSVRLVRYAGRSVAVGSVSGITAKMLGTATGLDGRIWVMWGDENGGLAVTRSNKAVTRFEPIQQVNPHAFTLYRIGGDGRLGPLDLLVEQSNGAGKVGGTFYARVLPVLSASTKVAAVKNKSGIVVGHTLTVTVSDAGDAVPGATVKVSGHTGKTDGKGHAQITLSGSSGGTAQISVTEPGYQPLSAQASL
jgi:hypothetical protein